tara:strand:- start:6 stop:377 length:372 start_codon:yes stop_codon:yes gene_type:complete
MIYEGEYGSINGYFKKKLIVSRPLTKNKSIESYKKESVMVLVQALRDGNNLPNIKKLALLTLKNFRYEETIREPTSEDRDFVLFTLLILIKLGVVEEDSDREGLLIMGPKKVRRDCETPVRRS